MPRTISITLAGPAVACRAPTGACAGRIGAFCPALIAEHLRVHREAASLLHARPELGVEDLREAVERAPQCGCKALDAGTAFAKAA